MHLLDAGNKTGDDVGIHNIYLRVWGEAGILPFVLYMLFWGITAWQSFTIPIPWMRMTAIALWLMLTISGLTSHDMFEFDMSGASMGFMLALFVVHHFMDIEKKEI